MSFYDGFKVRGVFFDILKVFDKVWHKGINLQQKQNGISGKLLVVLWIGELGSVLWIGVCSSFHPGFFLGLGH